MFKNANKCIAPIAWYATLIHSGAGMIFQQGGQEWTNLFQLGVWVRCKPPARRQADFDNNLLKIN